MTQRDALRVLLSGVNVFLTGPPGSGKSYVLGEFVKRVSKLGLIVEVTASTGIAAGLLSGSTIHAWSGLGIIQNVSQELSRLLNSASLIRRLNTPQILIIDEVSMLDAHRLDSLDLLLRHARSNLKPFGGLQVILCGDFFQLPPVGRGSPDYAFKAKCWPKLDLSVCYLSEQHRQEDSQLSDILLALRERRLNRGHLDILLSRQGIGHEPTTMLLTHNIDVDKINDTYLARLPGKAREYSMVLCGDQRESKQLASNILAPRILTLKAGASVMFVANDLNSGYANGTQGKVVGFKGGLPAVEINGGKIVVAKARRWKREINGRVVAEVAQLPLKLSWATTIHKSQGMSLKSAEINLKRSFTFGMGYVALSRLTSIDGLYLNGINSRSLQLDPEVYEFDAILKEGSKHTQNAEVVLNQMRTLLDARVDPRIIQLSMGIKRKGLKEFLRLIGRE